MCLSNYFQSRRIQALTRKNNKTGSWEVCKRWYIWWIVSFWESSWPKADLNHEQRTDSFRQGTYKLFSYSTSLIFTPSFGTEYKQFSQRKEIIKYCLEMDEAQPLLKHSTCLRCWFHLSYECGTANTEEHLCTGTETLTLTEKISPEVK